MKIVAVAADTERLQRLQEQLMQFDDNAQVVLFADPMAAVKYLYAQSADFVFTEAELKHMRGTQFVNLVRKKHPSIDITVLCDNAMGEELFRSAGADRLMEMPLTEKQFLQIIREVNTPPNE